MKLCYLIDGLRLGGAERQLFELIKGLIKRKYLKPEEILIISLYRNAFMDNSFKELGIRFEYSIRRFKKDLFLLIKLNKIIKDFEPDIVHSLSTMTSFYTLFLKIFKKFIFIDGTVRSAVNRRSISLKMKLLNYINFYFADYILVNSQAGLSSFKVPTWKSYVIYNGFDKFRLENLECKEIIRKKFGITTDKVVGMVANFTIRKDYKTFLLAAQRILSKRNDVTFLAIGDGQYLEKLKWMVVPESQNNILFLGSQSNVESIVNIFDVGVLSTHSEGISNSIMEYMALGKSVVATDGGGTKELVEDGQTGFLVKPGNIEEMQNRIIQLLVDSKLGRKMGYRGKERILSEFDLEKMVSSYYNFYKNITK